MKEKQSNMLINISSSAILKVIVAGLLVVSLYLMRDLVLVILTSVVIATFISAAANRLKRFYINRTLGVVLMYILTIAVIASIFYFFVPIVINETSNVIGLVSRYLPDGTLNSLKDGTLSGAKDFADGISSGRSLPELIDTIKNSLSSLSSGFFDSITIAFGGILNFVLVVVISFYLSIEEKGVEKFLRLVTPLKKESYVIDLWERTERKIALWVKGQLILGLIVGVLTYLGLAILGIQYALILAFIAAILELIPFGIILATVPAVAFAYIDGGITLALMVAGFYIIVQQFESYLIQPLVVKKVIGISPLVVLLSVLAGAKLAGFWGLILAIPVAVVFMEYASDVENRRAAMLPKPEI
jgi:predicted PurR-regulated permease PerM